MVRAWMVLPLPELLAAALVLPPPLAWLAMATSPPPQERRSWALV